MTHATKIRAGGVTGVIPLSFPYRRPAFSLMEMMVVLAGLQVFLGVMVGVLWAGIRIERAAGADFQRALVHGTLADQFRADVAGAASAPMQAADMTAGPQSLILRQSDDKLILYRWDGQRLERSVRAGARTHQQVLSVGDDPADVVFERAASGRLITLQLTETRGQGSAGHKERTAIAAALGGDVQ